MNYKLKHLSKYCCKPANELEFEAVKMAAEIGGVEFDCSFVGGFHYFITNDGWRVGSKDSLSVSKRSIITVLDFISKLRMTEEEAEKLEDNRVELSNSSEVIWTFTNGKKSMVARSGYKWKTNEDGTEVTLHKRESC